LTFLPQGTRDYAGSAGALLMTAALPLPADTIGVVVANPLLACARAASWLPVRTDHAIAEDTKPPSIDCTAEIAPDCLIEAGASIGAASRVGAWTRVGRGARIGDHCVIGERVSLGDGVTLGNRVRVESGAVIGADAFVAVRDGLRWVRFPAFSSATIQDDVCVGANCTVARGAFRPTLVGYRVQLDAQVHIGHDAQIGADSIVAGGASIGGGTSIGTECVLGGRVAVVDGVSIAERVTITAMSLVTKSIAESASHWSGGWPVQRSKVWWRALALWRRRVR